MASVILSNLYEHSLFNELITSKIKNRIVVAAFDASIKDGQMLEY